LLFLFEKSALIFAVRPIQGQCGRADGLLGFSGPWRFLPPCLRKNLSSILIDVKVDAVAGYERHHWPIEVEFNARAQLLKRQHTRERLNGVLPFIGMRTAGKRHENRDRTKQSFHLYPHSTHPCTLAHSAAEARDSYQADRNRSLHMSKSKISAADQIDIKLVVNATVERGSMTENQILALGISRESYVRNIPHIAAELRARNIDCAA
jgi:hypothetical protein